MQIYEMISGLIGIPKGTRVKFLGHRVEDHRMFYEFETFDRVHHLSVDENFVTNCMVRIDTVDKKEQELNASLWEEMSE
jgi:hypothetical protein